MYCAKFVRHLVYFTIHICPLLTTFTINNRMNKLGGVLQMRQIKNVLLKKIGDVLEQKK
jgi:hypothetical protein